MSQFLFHQAEMQKSRNIHQKEYFSDDVYDSADDLCDNVAEEIAISQKIPESFVGKYTQRNTEQFSDYNTVQNRKNSPLKEKDLNNPQHFQNQPENHQTDITKQVSQKAYGIELKERPRNNQLLDSHLEFQSQSNKPTNSPLRAKGHVASMSSYPFNNKENSRQIEEMNLTESKYSPDRTQPSPFTEIGNKRFMQQLYPNNKLRQINVAQTNNQDLLLTQNEVQKINEKRSLASKEQQENTINRLTRPKNENKSYVSKEAQECTFAPHVTNNSKPRRNFKQFLEAQEQFQNQVEMKKKRAQQEKEISSLKKEEAPHKPAMCPGSQKILGKKKQENQPFHQRLYNTGKTSQAKSLQRESEKENSEGCTSFEPKPKSNFEEKRKPNQLLTQNKKCNEQVSTSFTPNIHKKSKNLKRDDRVDNILYNDALRRQHKSVEVSKMKSKSTISGPIMSLASRRALAMRFIKEFDIAVLEFLEVGKEPKLNYVQLHEFLKKLCFLKESEQIENPHFTPERVLLYDMWYTLYADKREGVHRRNLLVFLLGILNLHFPITKIQHHPDSRIDYVDTQKIQRSKYGNHENEGEKESLITSPTTDNFTNPVLPGETDPPTERKIIGEYDKEGNFELTEEEVRRLHKIYDPWYINRMCSGDNLGQLISTRSQQEYSYHPEINQSSKILAQNYREKILEGTAELIQQNKLSAPKDGKITHIDLLIVSKKVAEEKIQKYGELLKEEKSKDYTYQPQINQYNQALNASTYRSNLDENLESRDTQSKKQTPVESLGKDRVFELYALAKPHVLKTDKNKIEVDYEKNYKECTFQPNLGPERDSKIYSSEPKELFVKGIEKTVDRMRNARTAKEQQMAQLARGFSNGNEGHFIFSVEKKKYGNDLISVDRKSSYQKYPNTRSKMYEGNIEDIQENQLGLEYGSQRMQNEGNQEGRGIYYTYEQQMQQYGNPTYGIEQENELLEIRELDTNSELYQQTRENENKEDEYQEELQEENEEQYYEQEETEEQNNHDIEADYQNATERVPLLFVDVNLGQGRAERIIVYEGDRSEELAQRFAEENGLDENMKEKLKCLLDSQIDGLLSRIDEELYSETDKIQYSQQYGQDHIEEENDEEEESYR